MPTRTENSWEVINCLILAITGKCHPQFLVLSLSSTENSSRVAIHTQPSTSGRLKCLIDSFIQEIREEERY